MALLPSRSWTPAPSATVEAWTSHPLPLKRLVTSLPAVSQSLGHGIKPKDRSHLPNHSFSDLACKNLQERIARPFVTQPPRHIECIFFQCKTTAQFCYQDVSSTWCRNLLHSIALTKKSKKVYPK